MIDVPHLHENVIEQEADLALARAAARFEDDGSLATPIDAVVEFSEQLEWKFSDLQREFDCPDVHGAIWIERRAIAVDFDLDPTRRFLAEGRFRFTLAHELGHWILHRGLFLAQRSQQALYTGAPESPSFICRRSESKRAEEWQADRFAACILMPRTKVQRIWRERHGDDAVYLRDLEARRDEILAQGRSLPGAPLEDEANVLFRHVARPLAEGFNVSPPAMSRRLEELGFFRRTPPPATPLLFAT